MPQQRKQNYLHGAMILTISAVIIKILGAVYKIPLYNILNTAGTADFTAAYRIYGVLLAFSSAGLPVALSRLISEAHALGHENQVNRTYNVGYVMFLVLGGIGTLIMLAIPSTLAVWMEDPTAAQSILMLSPSVLLVCLMSAYRGYAQGHSDMIPTAVSQVLEVAIKVILGLIIAWLLYSAAYSSSQVSAGAIFGVAIGSAVALIFMIFAKHKLARTKEKSAFTDTPDSVKKTFFSLLKICIPILLSSSVISIISLIDTKLALGRLQDVFRVTLGGADAALEEAKKLFGEYTYATTVADLPATFTTALSIAVVPAIASLVAKKKRGEVRTVAESSLRVGTLLILPMGIGMAALASPILNTLYFGKITDIGPQLMLLLGLSVYFSNMALMTNAVLQAAGHQFLPIVSMLAGVAVKIALSWTLVGNADIGIVGAPLSTIGCFVVVCLINLFFMQRVMSERLRLSRIILKPLSSCAAMGLAAWAAYGLLDKLIISAVTPGRIIIALCMLAAIAVAIAVYLLLIVLTKAITAEDIKLIPKGEKLAKLLKIK